MSLQLRRTVAITSFVACLAGCSQTGDTPEGGLRSADGAATVETSTAAIAVATIDEAYVTAADEAMNIDSVATHRVGDLTWLFATAKEGNVIRIYDAASGALLRDFGNSGDAAGEFRRPNGIVAIDGLLLVVERDNRRVQVFALPELEPLVAFGEETLIKPYGAYLRRLSEERYDVYITDAYETADEQVPPDHELNRRVQHWTLEVTRGADGGARAADASHLRSFGATSGPGMLRVVESIWGDPAYDRLLVAEEDPAGGRVIKIYSLAGRYADLAIGDGIFAEQPEGIALYACADGSGYWVTTDQQPQRSVFHLFDRRTLRHAGAFEGVTTRNTDGIWLSRDPIAGFPTGALFAVHDDQAVAAFDWRAIAASLNLNGCPES